MLQILRAEGPKARMWPRWADNNQYATNHAKQSPHSSDVKTVLNEQWLQAEFFCLSPLPSHLYLKFKPFVLSREILWIAPTSVRIIHHPPG